MTLTGPVGARSRFYDPPLQSNELEAPITERSRGGPRRRPASESTRSSCGLRWRIVRRWCCLPRLELDVFTALADGPQTADELAAACGAHEPPLRMLLEACVADGLLTRRRATLREHAGGRRLPRPRPPGLQRARLKYAEDLYPAWGRLAELRAHRPAAHHPARRSSATTRRRPARSSRDARAGPRHRLRAAARRRLRAAAGGCSTSAADRAPIRSRSCSRRRALRRPCSTCPACSR